MVKLELSEDLLDLAKRVLEAKEEEVDIEEWAEKLADEASRFTD